jgi:hypothetical protein
VQNYICTQEQLNCYVAPEKWLNDIAHQLDKGKELNDFNIKNSKKGYEHIRSITIASGNASECYKGKFEFEETIQKIIEISKMEQPNDLATFLLKVGSISATSYYPTGKINSLQYSPYHSCYQDFEIKKINRRSIWSIRSTN